MPIYKPGTTNPKKKNTVILIYGPEGSFKTSIALTTNNAILFDFNEGSWRAVNISEKTRFIPNTGGWNEFTAMQKNGDFDDYNTFIFDTTRDLLIRHLASQLYVESPALKSLTGGLTKDGYAALAARFSEDLASKINNKVIIFIAHDSVISENDLVKHGPDIPGSVNNYILGSADQIGYIEKNEKGGVSIKFSNNNSYHSKDTARIGDIQVPHFTEKEWPTFFQDSVIDPLSKYLSMSADKIDTVHKALDEWALKIDLLDSLDAVNKILPEITALPVGTKELVKSILKKKCDNLGLEYNKKENTFIQRQ